MYLCDQDEGENAIGSAVIIERVLILKPRPFVFRNERMIDCAISQAPAIHKTICGGKQFPEAGRIALLLHGFNM